MTPKLTLSADQKGIASNTQPSVFVIGLTPEGKAQRPHIITVQDGPTIEVTVVGRQPDGATVDVAIEQSRIRHVETKKIGDNRHIQIPHVDISKKRVIDFVKYGQTLAIPIDEDADKGASRVELLILAGKDAAIPPNWISPAESRPKNADDVRRCEVFCELLASGGAKIRCEWVSRFAEFWNSSQWKSIASFKDEWDFVDSCLAWCPRQSGLVDVLRCCVSVVSDPNSARHLETAAFGCNWAYSVELQDTPSLALNIRRLGKVPSVWNLIVGAKRVDYAQMHDLTRINVRNELTIDVPFDFEVPLDLVSGDLKGYAWHLSHPQPGYAKMTLEPAWKSQVFTVYVDEAKAAIPALKSARNLKHILIIGERGRDEKRVEQERAAMQKTLPDVAVTTCVLR